MVGHVLEKLWKGRCDIVVLEKHKDPDTRRMVSEKKILFTGIPCRLSFETVAAAGEPDRAAQLTQSVKLFLDRGIKVPEGSELVVTQNGVTTAYHQSGPPAVYSHHQELRLELVERWA